MFDFLNKNKKLLSKFNDIKNHVNSLEGSISKLSNDELKNKTNEFKQKLKQGATLDQILPEAFAVVREASKRVLNKRHFDVQIIGGLALHYGMIAEMVTGEGKTLVATLAAYLNALEGKGVHVVTVNDYLAKRDSEWMGEIYKFLNLSVGSILSNLGEEERKIAYSADITYGTNNEFGFDYLRDNMKFTLESLVQRPFNYVIIDEVDSVLIDEARTPLIISGAAEDNTNLYKVLNSMIKYFEVDDFDLEEKNKNLNLTEKGFEKIEDLLAKGGIKIKGSLFDSNNLQIYHLIIQCLRAHYLFNKNTDYIVQNNEVVIIDEFTGRMMEGRRFSEGLHQALEAKENVKVNNENQTLASITFQNYFKMYPKLSGMTGTAFTESKEFMEIYGLNVLPIPSNKPLTRLDKNDLIYLSYSEKVNAIVAKVKEFHEKKLPILIGTVSIEKSELLSNTLKKIGLKHNVLNAKHHEKEAQIIAQAGVEGAITIATNMAGRGTDIQLGGNLEMLIAEKTAEIENEEQKQEIIKKLEEQVSTSKEYITSLGGLVVIGTERHESRRIDNQLRGRSGRQGEPGVSLFYISLEDDLMRIFGSNKIDSLLQKFGFKADEAITHPFITKAIEKAQKRVEDYNFQIRKNLLRFDNVINEQRKLIYEQRKEILEKKFNALETVHEIIDEVCDNTVEDYFIENQYRENWNYEAVTTNVIKLLNVHLDVKKLALDDALSIEELKSLIKAEATKNIKEKINLIGEEEFKDLSLNIMLQNVDFSWKKHLANLDYIRNAINLRAYSQKDPFVEYQKEAFEYFQVMLDEIKENYITILSHLSISEAESIAENETEEPLPANADLKNLSRNALCPCGSGKKFKHCHGSK